jgi:hypothetical protein
MIRNGALMDLFPKSHRLQALVKAWRKHGVSTCDHNPIPLQQGLQ